MRARTERALSRRLQARIARALALGLVALAVAVAARGLERRTTWYLASDQFAFLTFAGDLARGAVLHPPAELERLAPLPRGTVRDVFFRTYFWDGERVYSRYPPGFPALLAAAGVVGGETAQHLVNPLLFLALLAVVAWISWAAVRPHDRSLAAGTAVAAVWLLLLLPTQIHLWGSTVARDLLAHLLALGSLVAALYAAPASAGLLLGLACTVRPDAVLYGASLAALLATQSARLRAWLASGGAFLLGILPLLAYNHATRGSLFAFTQGGEFDRLLSSLVSPYLVLAQATFASGGGFRLAHLADTLPGNLELLGRAFSAGWVAIAAGLAWSLRTRPVLAAATLPYALVAIPFYGCWPHPDARYLAGVSVVLVLLEAAGAAVVCRRLADPACARGERVAAAGVAIAAALWSIAMRERGLHGAAAEVALAAAVVVAALSGGSLRFAVLAPGVALAIAGLGRAATSEGGRDPFQRPEMLRAVATLEGVGPAGSLVIVGGGLGRPAENIAHYTHADAHYLSELPLAGTNGRAAARGYAREGRRTFLMAAADDIAAIEHFPPGALVLLERREGPALYAWFVDPERARAGADLHEVRLPPAAPAPPRER